MFRIFKNSLPIIIAILLFSASTYFTWKVIKFKQELNYSVKDLEIYSGMEGKVVKVIDGDEISLKHDNNQFIVRILGIKSFDPTITDPDFQNIGKLALYFLEKKLLNKNIKIIFEKFKLDKKNRLLAYVHVNNLDIGKEMINKGYSLVYLRFPFSRMENYISEERLARLNKTGLWSIPIVAKRSLGLKKTWLRKRGK